MASDDLDFWALHGLPGPEFDLEPRWNNATADGPLQIPFGVDANGTTVALDFSRWSSLDDHVLIVGAPAAGTTTLLRTVALGVCIARSPADANLLLVEGKPNQGEFADLAEVKHCVGHVTFSRGEESRILERLADVLAGEVARRGRLFQTAGVSHIDDYRHAAQADADLEPLPEVFTIVDNLTWLHAAYFDTVAQMLTADGHRCGLRVIAGAPYDLWQTLHSTGYFDAFTARVALGLSAEQASDVLGATVTDELVAPGAACFNHLGGEPVRVRVAMVDT